MSARLFFVRCSQAECEFGVLILIKGVNGRCWLCFVLFTESYNRVCCKGPGMTCGGDGKATWMCNFVVRLSETYRVTWREGGEPSYWVITYIWKYATCFLIIILTSDWWEEVWSNTTNDRPPTPSPISLLYLRLCLELLQTIRFSWQL